MFTHRTSVLALAAIATLALAASTDAEASPFCHRFGSFSRAYFPAAPQQRIVSAKPRFDAARTAKKYVGLNGFAVGRRPSPGRMIGGICSRAGKEFRLDGSNKG